MDSDSRRSPTRAGLCRELLRTYGPETTVLVDAGGEVGKVHVTDLLPYPWMRAAETEWDILPPRVQETAA